MYLPRGQWCLFWMLYIIQHHNVQPLGNKTLRETHLQHSNSDKMRRQKKKNCPWNRFQENSTADIFWHLCSCSSSETAAKGLWITRRMVHPKGSFSVIWHLFNICSPTEARHCGLFTAGQPERQKRVTKATAQCSIVQCSSDLEDRPASEMEIKVWPSTFGNTRSLIEVKIQLCSRLGENFKTEKKIPFFTNRTAEATCLPRKNNHLCSHSNCWAIKINLTKQYCFGWFLYNILHQ